MDVDLSTDLDALLPLVAPLLSGHSDISIGSRLAPGARVVRGPRREVISRGYNLVLKAVLHNGFSDAQCGFKAARREVAQALLPLVEDNGWFFDTELLVLAEHNGLRIHEVPVDWVDDPDSRVSLATTAMGDLNGIWRMVRRFAAGDGNLPAGALAPGGIDPGLSGQMVRFAAIGAVSTVMFAALFLLLAGPLGADPGRRGRPRPLRRRQPHCQPPDHVRAQRWTGPAPAVWRGTGDRGPPPHADRCHTVRPRTGRRRLTASRARLPHLGQRGRQRCPVQLPAGLGDASAQAGSMTAVGKLIRYAAVSAVATTVSLTILGVLVATGAVGAGWANVIATAVGTVPSFELNRRWVWNKPGRRSLLGEVAPFCALSFLGLGLSTLAVSSAATWASASGLGTTVRTMAAEAANVATYGSLWLAQYVLLDRVLFKPRPFPLPALGPEFPDHIDDAVGVRAA